MSERSIDVSQEELSHLPEQKRSLFSFNLAATQAFRESAEIIQNSTYQGEKTYTPGALFQIVQFLHQNAEAALLEAESLATEAKSLSKLNQEKEDDKEEDKKESAK